MPRPAPRDSRATPSSSRWTSIDAPLDLADPIEARHGPDAVLLIDCLTLWTSNLMFADADIDAACRRLVECVDCFDGTIILVANEVGLGIVPDNALVRRFRDEAGRINQAIAGVAREVVLVTAGIAMTLK